MIKLKDCVEKSVKNAKTKVGRLDSNTLRGGDRYACVCYLVELISINRWWVRCVCNNNGTKWRREIFLRHELLQLVQ